MSERNERETERLAELQRIIRRLHAGEPPQQVKEQLRALLGQVSTEEIAAMEQTLMREGMAVEEIMGMCDLHHQVMAEMIAAAPQEVPAGHPVDTLRRENAALAARASELRTLLEALAAPTTGAPAAEEQALAARAALNDLMDVEKHYRRKENLIFPFLERHGISGPSKVMWGKHDEARALLKALERAWPAAGAPAGAWRALAEGPAARALSALEEMIAKEEHILIPMTLERFAPEEWGDIYRQSPEIGWCLVDPRGGYEPPPPAGGVPAYARSGGAEGSAASAAPGAVSDGVVLPTGSLSLEQLRALFDTLPVDITFVDAEDRVRFYSEGKRVFVRAPAIIGRLVHHCHPPKSVHIVEKILDDFRSGRQSAAEFWIEMRGRFIHIRYFALRDAGGRYLGTLEVTQDATGIRALQGERRLLAYE
ncbi:MAG: DUF438 domain-containing protein [Candidatus Eisenbacteria bacterium]|uniref:DUF438 domain-containing protein n=1 Tax=Eiseniibacteriota bacterium TaxID=2212470 RepID=A0A937XDK6_UNCEI|nr:DUF438 domain-containing protein [Candidatus Eisenbacteria bacterium]